MDGLIDWLSSLSPAALYGVLALAAALENVFPPLPSDTVVVLGSFLAARTNGSAVASFLSTWSGNLAGAMFMYAMGRRYGAAWLRERVLKGGAKSEARLEAMYARHGLWALVLSRFLPGIRALVPPFAGAFRISPLRAGLAIGGASGVWYAFVTWMAFRVGASWAELSQRIAGVGRTVAIVVGAIVLAAVAVWLVRRRR